jgi:chromosome segregation ATPase
MANEELQDEITIAQSITANTETKYLDAASNVKQLEAKLKKQAANAEAMQRKFEVVEAALAAAKEGELRTTQEMTAMTGEREAFGEQSRLALEQAQAENAELQTALEQMGEELTAVRGQLRTAKEATLTAAADHRLKMKLLTDRNIRLEAFALKAKDRHERLKARETDMMKRNADSAAHGKALSDLRKDVELREAQILVRVHKMLPLA